MTLREVEPFRLPPVSTDHSAQSVSSSGQMWEVSLDNVTSGTVVTIDQANTAQFGYVGTLSVSSVDADPKIPGTRVPVYRIAALLRGGLTVDQVAEDFPSLTKTQIRSARIYANAHPPIGVVYPAQSLKRLLRHSGFARLERELKKTWKRS